MIELILIPLRLGCAALGAGIYRVGCKSNIDLPINWELGE